MGGAGIRTRGCRGGKQECFPCAMQPLLVSSDINRSKFNCTAWDNNILSYAQSGAKFWKKTLHHTSSLLPAHSSHIRRTDQSLSAKRVRLHSWRHFKWKTCWRCRSKFQANFNWNDDYKSNHAGAVLHSGSIHSVNPDVLGFEPWN